MGGRHSLALIYASNEPKSVLARDLGDYRDNLGKLAKRVFHSYITIHNNIIHCKII